MSVVHVIDTLTDWAQKNICNQILLKAAPDNSEENAERYDYELVNPTAFAMFVPTAEKLPPKVRSNTPSLCVRFVKGGNNLSSGEGSLNVQFFFSAWDPGIHSEDMFHPVGDGTFARQEPNDKEFTYTGTGWRDVWNFVDLALRKLGSQTNIDGVTIDRSTPIEFGPLTEQEAIPDFYPFWFAWISFRVTYPFRRNDPEIENFL